MGVGVGVYGSVAHLEDATATSGVFNVDASPNHMNELSLIK